MEKFSNTISYRPLQITKTSYIRRIVYYVLLSSLFAYVFFTCAGLNRQFSTPERIDYQSLANHCAGIFPIGTSEYIDRQNKLAQTLHSLNASAYIIEPGPSAQYYANVSLADWHLSERPFLIVIVPTLDSNSLLVTANVSIVAPKFEVDRATLLPIPTQTRISYGSWSEDASPYAAVAALLQHDKRAVYIDEGARYFVAVGIQRELSAQVLSTPPEIRALRERKSKAEMQIMRCANEVTLLALRTVRQQLFIGIRESEAKAFMYAALAAAGLRDAFALVLFGENAALPHGTGTDRVLGENELILFDVGGSLHSYHSDLTRTFALKASFIPEDHLNKWYIVQSAQKRAHSTAREGIAASEVDKAARDVIKLAGYGDNFTHRLGHGIGLEMHESPYLRGGYDSTLAVGNTFSNEPGIYIPGKVGIRLEDCFVIDEDGRPQFLTAGVGGLATSPWSP